MTLLVAVVACALLTGATAALVWLVRDRREVRSLIGAESGQPTDVALRRRLRRTVEREELSAALFARVSVREHMANYQAATALLGKGKSRATKGAEKSAMKKAKPKK